MARRNTQRPPQRQATAWATRDNLRLVHERVDGLADLVGRIDRQMQVFERAFISLAQDVEYISAVLDREGLLVEEDEGLPDLTDYRPSSPVGDEEEVEAYRQDVDRFEDEGGPVAEEPEESPEEEAARLIAEAERLNEVDVTDAKAYYDLYEAD